MDGIYRVLVVMMIYIALATTEALAAKHVVTWDLSSDLSSWAKGRTFKVGDQLVFKYTSGLHSLVELSGEKEYKNCDIGNALDSMNGGNDAIKLTKPGTRYFACGTLGHCDQGMKLQIKTVAANEAGSSDDDQESSPSSSTSTSSPTSTTSTTSTSAGGVQSVASFISIFASITIGLLNMV
ncbi:Plastocyanin-like [Macleaya cordata]|uniref:Plastocyanin-like n=1 Tax=Macleaya cordata TaxID=56857 RepID=A0A200R4A4_MACCD|nr:Plastocyanin-like [Macleaya cordata]